MTARRPLFVHAGSSKTGTSALCGAEFRRRSELRLQQRLAERR